MYELHTEALLFTDIISVVQNTETRFSIGIMENGKWQTGIGYFDKMSHHTIPVCVQLTYNNTTVCRFVFQIHAVLRIIHENPLRQTIYIIIVVECICVQVVPTAGRRDNACSFFYTFFFLFFFQFLLSLPSPPLPSPESPLVAAHKPVRCTRPRFIRPSRTLCTPALLSLPVKQYGFAQFSQHNDACSVYKYKLYTIRIHTRHITHCSIIQPCVGMKLNLHAPGQVQRSARPRPFPPLW